MNSHHVETTGRVIVDKDKVGMVVYKQAGDFMVPPVGDVVAAREGESGTVDWVLGQALGPRKEALGWLEGLVKSTDLFEVPIGRMVLAAKTWIEQGERWDWNKAAAVAGVSSEQVMSELAKGMRQLGQMTAMVKMARELPKVAEATIESAQILGKEGFSDREMVLKMMGLVESKGGVQVNVQQNNVNRMEGLKGGGLAPLKQFTEGAEEIDGMFREGQIVDAEIVEERRE